MELFSIRIQRTFQLVSTVKELLADIHATRYTFWRYPHWRLWQFLASAGK